MTGWDCHARAGSFAGAQAFSRHLLQAEAGADSASSASSGGISNETLTLPPAPPANTSFAVELLKAAGVSGLVNSTIFVPSNEVSKTARTLAAPGRRRRVAAAVA